MTIIITNFHHHHHQHLYLYLDLDLNLYIHVVQGACNGGEAQFKEAQGR